MDDKSFATNIIEKTVEKLNSESDLNKDFDSVLSSGVK